MNENEKSIQVLSDLIDCGGFRLGSDLDSKHCLSNARQKLQEIEKGIYVKLSDCVVDEGKIEDIIIDNRMSNVTNKQLVKAISQAKGIIKCR